MKPRISHGSCSVTLEDTTLAGIATTAGPGVLLRAEAASGLVLSQSHGADVVRSTISSVTGSPLGTQGVQTGVLLTFMLGDTRLANSVVSTTRGSDVNVAISAHSLGGAGSLSLFYVTALAGNDYDRTGALPPNHWSAPIALSGELGSVRILNSVLANGAGLGVSTLQTVIAGIDRGMDRMTADPRTFELRGTAISFPFRDYYESEALVYCEPDAERYARNIYNESDLNYAAFHRCYPIASGSSYVSSDNLAFNAAPDEVPTLGRPAVRFSPSGRPLPSAATPSTVAITALRSAGVDLTTEPVAAPETLAWDLARVARLVTPPGAGAWVLP